MNIKKIEDLSFGLDNEKKWLKYMGKLDEGKWEKTPNKYDSFDFRKGNSIAELKSRKINHNKHRTTFFGANKIYDILTNKYGDYREMKFTFYFLYLNGLYKWDFKKGDYFIANGGRRDRGRDETCSMCYIPIEKLECVSKSISSI